MLDDNLDNYAQYCQVSQKSAQNKSHNFIVADVPIQTP